ncbi:hypothetical protein HK101_009580 [Irineochytrium annulatum]|nr:hypothetical protein HK101_009580 [Irineochytrium annulatum]
MDRRGEAPLIPVACVVPFTSLAGSKYQFFNGRGLDGMAFSRLQDVLLKRQFEHAGTQKTIGIHLVDLETNVRLKLSLSDDSVDAENPQTLERFATVLEAGNHSEVLGLTTSVSVMDVDVKRACERVSQATFPDHETHPAAADALDTVSKAFKARTAEGRSDHATAVLTGRQTVICSDNKLGLLSSSRYDNRPFLDALRYYADKRCREGFLTYLRQGNAPELRVRFRSQRLLDVNKSIDPVLLRQLERAWAARGSNDGRLRLAEAGGDRWRVVLVRHKRVETWSDGDLIVKLVIVNEERRRGKDDGASEAVFELKVTSYELKKMLGKKREDADAAEELICKEIETLVKKCNFILNCLE